MALVKESKPTILLGPILPGHPPRPPLIRLIHISESIMIFTAVPRLGVLPPFSEYPPPSKCAQKTAMLGIRSLFRYPVAILSTLYRFDILAVNFSIRLIEYAPNTPSFLSRARSLLTFLVGLPRHVQRLISVRSFFICLDVCPPDSIGQRFRLRYVRL